LNKERAKWETFRNTWEVKWENIQNDTNIIFCELSKEFRSIHWLLKMLNTQDVAPGFQEWAPRWCSQFPPLASASSDLILCCKKHCMPTLVTLWPFWKENGVAFCPMVLLKKIDLHAPNKWLHFEVKTKEAQSDQHKMKLHREHAAAAVVDHHVSGFFFV